MKSSKNVWTMTKKTIVFVLTLLTITMCLTGCDDNPQKIGGGGQLQDYDSSTGKYK